MKLESMRELLALESFGSFSQTAEKLFLTQPSLSRHIAAMEKELGVLLLNRNTHKVEFTEAGLNACKTFRQILNLYNAMQSDFERDKAGIVGTLRIGALYYSFGQDLGPTLPFFQADYPNVLVSTYSLQPQEVFQGLIQRKYDIGLISEAILPESDLLSTQKLYTAGAVAMLSKKHPLAQRHTLTLAELKNETILLLNSDPYTSQSTLDTLNRCHFVPMCTITSEHTDTVPFSLLKSNCIYITAKGYTIPGFDDRICSIPILDSGLTYVKSFAWRKDNPNPVIPLFLSYARRQSI